MGGAVAAVTRESQVLRAKLELVLPLLLAAGRRLVADSRVRELYPEYLFLSHCVVRASVPLMRTASARARELGDDRVAPIVADYVERHIPEELGHDEWLLEDMAAVGVDREAVLARPPSPTVASVVGAQYYWIHHFHPVALLGYIALLEGYPPRADEIDSLQRRTGYPAEAFRTLSRHADLDPHHGEELDAVLDSLPLLPEQRAVLGLSAMSSVRLMATAIEEIVG